MMAQLAKQPDFGGDDPSPTTALRSACPPDPYAQPVRNQRRQHTEPVNAGQNLVGGWRHYAARTPH